MLISKILPELHQVLLIPDKDVRELNKERDALLEDFNESKTELVEILDDINEFTKTQLSEDAAPDEKIWGGRASVSGSSPNDYTYAYTGTTSPHETLV